MKLCWDNLEKIYLTKNGFLNDDNGHTLIELEACLSCGMSYLTTKYKSSRFCSRVCSKKGKYAPNYGKTFSVSHRRHMSLAQTGRKHSPEVKKKLSVMAKLRTHSDKTKQEMSMTRRGSDNGNYKGGVDELNVPLYDTYIQQISWCEKTRRNPENLDWLQIKCVYCGKWFMPKTTDVKNRITFLNGNKTSECRFYCSEVCKQACPIYNKYKYPKGFKRTNDEITENSGHEGNNIWRQEVIKRNIEEYGQLQCEICGNTNENELSIHHEKPRKTHPEMSLDPDNGWVLCSFGKGNNCHLKYGHPIGTGCSTTELAKLVCERKQNCDRSNTAFRTIKYAD